MTIIYLLVYLALATVALNVASFINWIAIFIMGVWFWFRRERFTPFDSFDWHLVSMVTILLLVKVIRYFIESQFE